MSFLRLYFIRHGQTENYGTYPFNGWTDVQLTEEGRRQLDQTIEAISEIPFQAVYSSDLSRAAYGGLALARVKGLALNAVSDFREIHFGDCEGLTWAVIQERYPKLAENITHPEADVTFPGGESAAVFRARVANALNQLVSQWPTGQVALVAHAGVNRAIIAALLGLSLAAMWSITQDFACLNVVDLYPEGGCQLRLVNAYAGPQGYFGSGPGFERIAGL
ncbi:MAG: histidine phosphatase family protein [Deltaproteobacteria bacterium]|jgi:alpha-ribazole phosphatase/probable phosphoglycerate mutase|nr:histidine phosphatase family protein [Deltaproteobacteria bacterium]